MTSNTSSKQSSKSLLTPAKMAWPSIILFCISLPIWVISSYLACQQQLAFGWAVTINAICAYLAFTVLHDASHRAVSQSHHLNDWLGRLAILPLIPLPVFRMFRFVHMQHHRFTNEDQSIDPDCWTSSANVWSLPFRWMTLDLYYFYYYLPKIKQRPKDEQKELYIALAVFAALIISIIYFDLFSEFLLYWLLPSRFAIFFLALAFDYLPHIPKKATHAIDPLQATNNRIGLEWLMTPLLLFQNYHLMHHLYPRVPFYRYIKIWQQQEPELRQKGALLYNWRAQQLK